MTPRLALLAVTAAILCAGCESRSDQATAMSNNSATDAMPSANDHKNMIHIEAEIQRLRTKLTRSSRGAYANGPRLITGRAGSETLLDRLYHAENNLADTKKTLLSKQHSILALEQNIIKNGALINSLKLKAEKYERNKRTIQTLQDDRKHSSSEINNLRALIIEAELKLLTLQSEHLNFARIILELEPGNTQGFLDLQDDIKEMTETLNPTDNDNDQPTTPNYEEDIQ